MKKVILNIGKALNKVEQKEVTGGMPPPPPPDIVICYDHIDCPGSMSCCSDKSSQPSQQGICMNPDIYDATCPYTS